MITIVFNLWVVELTSGQSSKVVYYCQALPQSKLIPRWGYAYHIAKLSSAQPSQAATGGSQISWAEISFIITAQPPTHPGIVVEKDKKEKEKKISVNKIKKIFTLLKQNKTEKKKWLEFKSQKSKCLDFILKKKIQKKKIKRKRKENIC